MNHITPRTLTLRPYHFNPYQERSTFFRAQDTLCSGQPESGLTTLAKMIDQEDLNNLSIIVDLINLETVDLSFTPLFSCINVNIMSGRIVELNLSCCNIQSLSVLSGLLISNNDTLEQLDLSNNSISKIGLEFLGLITKLTKLVLTDNPIVDFYFLTLIYNSNKYFNIFIDIPSNTPGKKETCKIKKASIQELMFQVFSKTIEPKLYKLLNVKKVSEQLCHVVYISNIIIPF